MPQQQLHEGLLRVFGIQGRLHRLLRQILRASSGTQFFEPQPGQLLAHLRISPGRSSHALHNHIDQGRLRVIVVQSLLGDRWVCPQESWEWFFPLPYFGRVIDLDADQVLFGFQFRKTGSFRTEAMSLDEIDSLGERLLSRSA